MKDKVENSQNKNNVADDMNEEIKLADIALAAMNESKEIALKVGVLTEHLERQQRLQGELKEFEEKKIWLEEAIANLNKKFGEVDATKDLQSLEEYGIKLEAVSKAIILVRRRLEPESALSKDIREYKIQVNESVARGLQGVGEQFQVDINTRVKDLLQCLETYSKAVGRVMAEQTVVEKRQLNYASVSGVHPKIQNLDQLEKYSDETAFMAMIPSKPEVITRNVIVNVPANRGSLPSGVASSLR